MPRTSNKTGFLCPVPGCRGRCGTSGTKPAPYASRIRRKRYCRVCRAKFPTTEAVSGPIERLTPDGLSMEPSFIDGAGI